ncbi:HipA domain-containing protein [Mycetocola saprophilus]|uniref:HipA domain-containing protein n=1 Tax=Mycetocola saprophilus TaxID=76636 RepID=UPI003BF070E4
MSNVLDVYLHGQLIAKIERIAKSRYRLNYTPEVVASQGTAPISTLLPITRKSYTGETVERFLENLLPDRSAVKERWAQEAGLPDTEVFGLLRHYGADVAGALEFYDEDSNRREEGNLQPISDETIAMRIRTVHADDSEWGDEDANRHFSLGGAQGKFALARMGNDWFDPTGQTPSTHIFKPGIANLTDSDITEHLVMQIARKTGLTVANTSIDFFAGERTLVVERFDRDTTATVANQRIHQEDFAQLTGRSTLQKYEGDGGPTVRETLTAIERTSAPEYVSSSKLQYVASLMFSWIIGNNDGHSKNYSLIIERNEERLTPLYDLNTYFPYMDHSALVAHDPSFGTSLELAFSINEKNRVGDLTLNDWTRLAAMARVHPSFLIEYGVRTALELPNLVRDAIEELPLLARTEVVDRLPHIAFIRSRAVILTLTGHDWSTIAAQRTNKGSN